MTIPDSLPEKRHRAARVIAANARDAGDLAELLDMLGLTAALPRLCSRRSPDRRAECLARQAHQGEPNRLFRRRPSSSLG